MIEAGFASIKRKYGASVSSKKVRTIKSEIYGRLTCHNIFSWILKELGQSHPFHKFFNLSSSLKCFMVNVLYGVAGEGRGHATRSEVVLDYLSKKHDVHVATCQYAYTYLKKKFPITEIDCFKIIYRNNKASRIGTFCNNALRFPLIASQFVRIQKIIRKLKPNIIITDFEPLVAYAGLINKIPVLSIDNQHLISRTTIPLPPYPLDKFFMSLITSSFIPKAHHYFTLSFGQAQPKKKDTTVIKPLLRERILKLKPSQGSHILVYQTSQSNHKLHSVLQSINKPFIVYGFHKNEKKGNVHYKKSVASFFQDLAGCEGIITNGGFSLMSEALYLRKPVLSIPVEHHFEQLCNAYLLKKSGYGMVAPSTTKKQIEKFLRSIPNLKKKLSSYPKYDNNESLSKIEKKIELLG